MSNLKNIDQLFKEKFEKFEVNAPQNSWTNISKNLNQPSKHSYLNHLKTYKYKIAGVAASASLFAYVLYSNAQITGQENQNHVTSTTFLQPEKANDIVVHSAEESNADLFVDDASVHKTETKVIGPSAEKTKKHHLNQSTARITASKAKITTAPVSAQVQLEPEATSVSQAAVFKIDTNNQIKKVGNTTMSESEFLSYINSLSDSSSMIITPPAKEWQENAKKEPVFTR